MGIVVSWKHSKCLNFIYQIFSHLLLRQEVLPSSWWPSFLTNNNPFLDLMTNWIGNSLICNFGWINESMILDQISVGHIYIFIYVVYKNQGWKLIHQKYKTNESTSRHNQKKNKTKQNKQSTKKRKIKPYVIGFKTTKWWSMITKKT